MSSPNSTDSSNHVLVVGGTRGLGRCLVQRLVSLGHNVTCIGRSWRPLDECTPGRIQFLPAALDQPFDADNLIKNATHELGALKGIVFCQRFRGSGDWDGEIAVTLSATHAILSAAEGHFEAQRTPSTAGAIVMIGSAASARIAAEQPASYHVAKAGLLQLMRFYAVRFAKLGVRVNCVTPGTMLKEESRDFYLTNQELMDFYHRTIPLGRMGTAEEVTDAILFLLGDSSRFVTGQEIVVDGGANLWLQESICREMSNLAHPAALKHRGEKS